MIATRWSRGTTSRKSSSRLPAISACWTDNPVTLPPGRARLAIRPPPTGSIEIAKTMGMTAVACFTVRTGVPLVTMTSTLRRTNSAAISAARSGRACDQRYSIAMVRPSIQPSFRSCPTKASVHGRQPAASAPRNPMVGTLPACCARAASGHASVPPSSVMNSRRLMGASPSGLGPHITTPLRKNAAVHHSKIAR
jgi:hypothetical protein